MAVSGTVLVTGAGRGLGLALAKVFTRNHWRVIALHRDPEHRQLLACHGALCEPVLADVTKPDCHRTVLRQLTGAPLDLVIHNAGATDAPCTLERLDLNTVREAIELHLIAPLALTAAMLPSLLESERPAVLLMGTRWADPRRPGELDAGGYYAYRASKAALAMAGRLMADDLKASGVEVVVIDPGPMRTRLGPAEATTPPECVARRILDLVTGPTLGRELFLNVGLVA